MIKFEDVKRAYKGKPGCMCGCRGTYAVPEGITEAADRSIVSDRSVKDTIRKINQLINWNDPDDVEEHVNDNYAYANNPTGTRTYVVYFK